MRLCFSNGGFEEETQRGAGERGGESPKAEQRGARFTDSAGPATVSNVEIHTCHPDT